MSDLTTDPNDPRLTHGLDTGKVEQAEAYLVLPQVELDKGFVRPVRSAYAHDKCGTVTKMSRQIAETYARDPKFYKATYCVHCSQHFSVSEFHWLDGSVLGS